MAQDFGDSRGNPAFNSALVNYREIRTGGGFSWDIRELFEFDINAGYMVDRTWDYFNNGLRLRSKPAPYVLVHLNYLFEVPGKRVRQDLEPDVRPLTLPDIHPQLKPQ